MSQAALSAPPVDRVWLYGVPFRPVDIATVPPGYLRIEQPANDQERRLARYGIVVYAQPLQEAEIRSFELVAFLDAQGQAKLRDDLAGELSGYAQEYLELAEDDPGAFRMELAQRIHDRGVHVYLPDFDRFSDGVLARLADQSRC